MTFLRPVNKPTGNDFEKEWFKFTIGGSRMVFGRSDSRLFCALQKKTL